MIDPNTMNTVPNMFLANLNFGMQNFLDNVSKDSISKRNQSKM